MNERTLNPWARLLNVAEYFERTCNLILAQQKNGCHCETYYENYKNQLNSIRRIHKELDESKHEYYDADTIDFLIDLNCYLSENERNVPTETRDNASEWVDYFHWFQANNFYLISSIRLLRKYPPQLRVPTIEAVATTTGETDKPHRDEPAVTKPKRGGRPKKNVPTFDERMRRTLKEKPETSAFKAKQWATVLGCSEQSIRNTDCWKELSRQRDLAKEMLRFK